jgi:hypothetical protein
MSPMSAIDELMLSPVAMAVLAVEFAVVLWLAWRGSMKSAWLPSLLSLCLLAVVALDVLGIRLVGKWCNCLG